MLTQPPKDRPRHRGPVRLVLTTLLAATLVLSGTLSARAFLFTEDDVDHYVSCFILMIFNPTEHAEFCLPYNGGPQDPASLVTGAGPVNPPPPPPIPTTTVVVVVPTVQADPTTTIDDKCEFPPDAGGPQAVICEIPR